MLFRATVSPRASHFQIRTIQTSATRPLRHPRYVVQQLNNYAYSALASKDLPKAESLLNKSLKICLLYTDPVLLADYKEGQAPATDDFAWWGNNHISSTYAALADVASVQGKHDEALKYLNEIHSINLRLFSQNGNLTPQTIVMETLCKIGKAHYFNGDHDAALRTFNEVLDLDQKYLGAIAHKSRGTSAVAYQFKGKMELDKKNFTEAKRFLDISWAIHRLVFGIDHDLTNHVIADVGRACAGLGDYSRAKTLIEHAGFRFEENNNNVEAAEALIPVHKEILEHLPHLKGVVSNPPVSRAAGIDLFPFGESPEEREAEREYLRWEKAKQAEWKKTHRTE